MENKYILKTDQSDSKSTLIYLKWFQSDPKVCKMAPKWCQNDTHPPICRSAVRRHGVLRPVLASKMCREINNYILFMDPFGSDTKRYDMHYMCHSTSICHFWHPFLHFPATFFHHFDKNCCQSDFKLNSELHKTINILRKNEYILKTDQSDSKVILIYPKWSQSDPKEAQSDPKAPPKWTQVDPRVA